MRCLLLLMLLSVLACAPTNTPEPPTTDITANDEDVAVIRAGVVGFVLATVDEEGRGRAPRPMHVLFVDHTINFCQFFETTGCEARPSIRFVAGGALVARNRAAVTLPAIDHPRVTTVSKEQARELTRGGYLGAVRQVYPGTVGVIRVALPAYDRKDHALLYITRYCGTLCGNGWLVHLARRVGEWKIEGSTMLWVS